MSSKALALKKADGISLFPSESEWAIIKDQATTLVKSGLLPRAINTPEKAIAIALKGRDLGIPMMHAFAHIFVTEDGKIGTTAELMLSLINRNCGGAVIDYLETTDKRCEIEAKRPGRKPTRFSFTFEEARRAGLLSKFNWQKYPAAMLRARAVAIAARAIYPDAIMGMSHLADELGADTDEDGQIIEASPPAAVAPAPAPLPPPAAQAAPEKPKTQAELRREIYALATEQMRLSDKELSDWVFDVFKKESKALTVAELEKFQGILERELAGADAHAQ